MKKTKGKTNTSITDEKEVAPPEKEIPAVEVKPQSPDSIFSSDKIDKYFITRSFPESDGKCEFRRGKIKSRG